MLVYSERDPIWIGNLIGRPAELDVRAEDSEGHPSQFTRALGGIIANFTYAGQIQSHEPKLRTYRVELIPWLSLLRYNVSCRIFHDRTVFEIIEAVFGSAFDRYIGNVVRRDTAYEIKVKPSDQVRFPRMEHCVQFNESDFNFISRLLEDHGLFYYFRHFRAANGKNTHTMVIGADRTAYGHFDETIGFGEAGQTILGHFKVTQWEETNTLRIGRRTQTDYDPLFPNALLEKSIAADPKIFKSPHEEYAFPGRYRDRPAGSVSEAEFYTQVRMEDEEARFHKIRGASGIPEFEPGMMFSFKYGGGVSNSHFGGGETEDFVLTSVGIVAADPGALGGDGDDWDKSRAEIVMMLAQAAQSAAAENKVGNVLDSVRDIANKVANAPIIGGSALGKLGGAIAGVVGIFSPFAALISGAIGLISALFGSDKKSRSPVYTNSFTCQPIRIPVRAGRNTPKPEIRGPQTAFVVGPDDEIRAEPSVDDLYIDDFGRVRVRFHWLKRDRQENVGMKPHSCWVRVSEGWAGSTIGQQFLPRVGQEVIVQFLDGDPDRPIITGRVYNGVYKQPFELQKYKSRSGIKTRTTPPQDGADRYHMLRFEDAEEKEQVLLRSQRRLDIRAFGSSYHTVGANYNLHVGYHDPQTDEQGGNLAIYAGGDHDYHVVGNTYLGIDKDWNLTIKGKTVADLQGGTTIKTQTLDLSARELRIEGVTTISLKVGSNFISISPTGVAIQGTMVLINSGGAPSPAQPAPITEPLDAAISDTGEPGFLERLRAAKGGGGRRTHVLNPFSFPNLPQNPDGTFQYGPGIRIDGADPAYAADVARDLDTIASTTSGSALINRLGAPGRDTLIRPASSIDETSGGPRSDSGADYAAGTPAGQPVFTGGGKPIRDASGHQLTGTGAGSPNVDVIYSPDHFPPPGESSPPGDTALMHEMTHGDHFQSGTFDGTPRRDGFTTNEEFNTIKDENSYRDERGVRRRINHHDI